MAFNNTVNKTEDKAQTNSTSLLNSSEVISNKLKQKRERFQKLYDNITDKILKENGTRHITQKFGIISLIDFEKDTFSFEKELRTQNITDEELAILVEAKEKYWLKRDELINELYFNFYFNEESTTNVTDNYNTTYTNNSTERRVAATQSSLSPVSFTPFRFKKWRWKLCSWYG